MNLVDKYNEYIMKELPCAHIAGVRVASFDKKHCETFVEFTWLNQNPYKSMFWAVQGMAAEFSNGFLLGDAIEASKHNIAMLLISNKSKFSKKAVGKITFNCAEINKVNELITRAIQTNQGQTMWLKSVGVDEVGDIVSEFEFEWSIKLRKVK